MDLGTARTKHGDTRTAARSSYTLDKVGILVVLVAWHGFKRLTEEHAKAHKHVYIRPDDVQFRMLQSAEGV